MPGWLRLRRRGFGVYERLVVYCASPRSIGILFATVSALLHVTPTPGELMQFPLSAKAHARPGERLAPRWCTIPRHNSPLLVCSSLGQDQVQKKKYVPDGPCCSFHCCSTAAAKEREPKGN